MIILNNNNYNNNNKTVITHKTLTGDGEKNKTNKQTNNNTYLLQPNYEKTTLSNMQRKHHVH